MSRRRYAATVAALLTVLVGVGSSSAASARRVSASNLSFVAFHMTSASTGWGVTAPRVLRTADSGRTWLDTTPAGLAGAGLTPSQSGLPLASFSFPGRDASWVAVPSAGRVRIFHTADDGTSWRTAVVTPGTLTGVSPADVPMVLGLDALDSRHGWLLVSDIGVSAGSEDVELYRTVDGGTAWTVAASVTGKHLSPGGVSPSGIPLGGDKTGVGFVSTQRGWLTGYGTQPGIWLYETENGGRAWRATTLPTPPGYPATGQYPATLPPVFIGEWGVLPAQWVNATIFYTTSDGGLHWSPTAPVPSPGGDQLSGWSWPNSSHGFAVTAATLCATSNGGRSWRCATRPASLKGITEVQYVSDRLGWAIADDRLLVTTNAGATWTHI